MRALKSKWMLVGLVAALAVFADLLIGPGLVPGDGPSTGKVDTPVLSRSASTGSTDQIIAGLQQRLRENPKDFPSYINLAAGYLQKYRENGDPSMYTKAEDLLDRAEKINPQSAELFATRSRLAIGRHDFAGALKLGERAVALDPENAGYYGVVGDAQGELGMYDEMVKSYQEMVDRRPDFSSYSRIPRARELYGDPEGAIGATQQAIDARSLADDENTAWAYVQLGKTQWYTGNLDEAAESYAMSLKILPGYPLGLAGQGQIAAARGELKRAAAFYEQAIDRMPLPNYVGALGDIYAKMGDRQKAQDQYALVLAINKLFEANGVNGDMETARFFADHDMKPQKSLEYARAAYKAQPNTRAADVLAWNLYKTGNHKEAQRYASEAIRLGTRDPLKLYHAGMIAKALGQKERAREYLKQAADLNPHFWVLNFEGGI